MKQFGMLLAILCLSTSISCTEQHDPTSHHKQISDERAIAQRPVLRLTEDGKIPAVATGGGEQLSAIDKKYQTFCASCHGMAGDSNTPAGNALVPKPRVFTDSDWQAKTTDEQIAKVIKEGGAAVGLSATMAAWGAMLTDAQISEMVVKIRKYK